MTIRKGKSGISSGEARPGNRVLRLLRLEEGPQACSVIERADREDDYNTYVKKEIEVAMVEAEYKKARAFMLQQRRNFC